PTEKEEERPPPADARDGGRPEPVLADAGQLAARAAEERGREREQEHACDGVLGRGVDGRVPEVLQGVAVDEDRDAADQRRHECQRDACRPDRAHPKPPSVRSASASAAALASRTSTGTPRWTRT